MSLESLLKDIKVNKVLAEENLEGTPITTLGAKRGRKSRAIESLKNLKDAYKNELMRTAAFVVVVGPLKDEFVKSTGALTVDPESFYKDLARRVSKSVNFSKESIANSFNILSRHLEDVATDLGLVSYPQIVFKQKYQKTVKTEAEFLELVKTIINDQVGAHIVGVHAVASIVDQAIAEGHTKPMTPILLNTSDEKLALHLESALKELTSRVFLVVVGEPSEVSTSHPNALLVKKVDKAGVKSVLSVIKNAIK